MAQTETRKLERGDIFPQMVLKVIDGAPITLPEKDKGTWGVLLIYRGIW